MEEQSHDLAKDTFLEKWPHWIRWILFLPAAIFVPILFFAFQFLMTTWFLDIGEDAFYIDFLRGAIFGGGVVIVGAMTAPNHQRVIALALLIVLSMFLGIAFLEQARHFVLNEFLENFITIIAAGYATYYIFQETK